MQAVIIGLGSMGRRRARLLREIDEEMVVVGVDLSPARREQAARELGIETYGSLAEASSGMSLDVALVCTSPGSHAPIIAECLGSGLHTFTELNLVADGYEDNLALARESGLALFLSSTFLYRRETAYIASQVAGRRGAYTYHVGQYLPDWHPWENWRDFFVARPETSGVREILAIELPWLCSAFGRVTSISSTSRAVTELGLPYDDVVALVVEHESGTVGTLLVDVACRRAVRRFEFVCEASYLTWDGTPETLRALDLANGEMNVVDLYGEGGAEHREGYASFVVEDAYRDELRAFLCAVAGSSEPAYGFAEDLETLKLIDEAVGAA